jgi:hypothetical protein
MSSTADLSFVAILSLFYTPSEAATILEQSAGLNELNIELLAEGKHIRFFSEVIGRYNGLYALKKIASAWR